MEEGGFIDMIVSEEWQSILLRFDADNIQVQKAGDKINELDKSVVMNGYNWATLLEYTLSKEFPELLEDLESMPEGGSYHMRFELSDGNLKRGKEILVRIKELISNVSELYNIVKQEGNAIKWNQY